MLNHIHVIKQAALEGRVTSGRIGSMVGDPPTAIDRVAAQQSWFASGSSGCVFARLAALKNHGWHYIVPELLDTDAIIEQVHSLAAEPDCQVISLLFPHIRTELVALNAIDAFCRSRLFSVERAVRMGTLSSVHVRLPLPEPVMAWVMAFGPLPNAPTTRQAPYFELAMRVRPKSGELFHRLNQDPGVAHLADLPMNMPPKYWEHRWASTLRRTRRILGGEPDSISAARCTFTTDNDTWDASTFGNLHLDNVDNDSHISEYESNESA